MWYIIIIGIIILFIVKASSNVSRSGNSNSNNGKIDSEYYFSNLNKVKQEAIAKLGNYCNKCGVVDNLHVHHKVPVSLGGIDDISNLEVLCKDCHEEEHGYKFDDEYKSDRKINSKKMKLINDSIYSGNKLTIKYHSNYNNQTTIRKITPIELYKKEFSNSNGYNWFLKSYCHLRGGERDFRINYIKEIL